MIRVFTILLLFTCSLCHAYERRIALVIDKTYYGELSFAQRIVTVCERLNWKAELVGRKTFETETEEKYDFVIHIVPRGVPHPTLKNYLAIFLPVFHYFHGEGSLKEEFSHFDGYLLTYTPGKDDKNFSGSNALPHLSWYPTVYDVPYREPDPNRLFYLCSVWGDRYTQSKYQSLMKLLSKQSDVSFYGDPKFERLYPSVYKGQIPFEGSALLDTINGHGVYLLIHSNIHNKYEVPSGRIFEAAASSAVIISDNNPFVKKFFGDSVLYIDTHRRKAKKIAKQIETHMTWIKKHKAEAIEKAKRAHEIFRKNFLLEDQLLKLAEFHDKNL